MRAVDFAKASGEITLLLAALLLYLVFAAWLALWPHRGESGGDRLAAVAAQGHQPR